MPEKSILYLEHKNALQKLAFVNSLKIYLLCSYCMLSILIDKDKQLDLKNSSRGINGHGEREQGRDNKSDYNHSFYKLRACHVSRQYEPLHPTPAG